ncbi:MAG: serine/threonine protein kinase [Planctomycetota bacterium]|nr:MAG: serine/threonine protein kinase [Planctomycetota bacterium]REK31724.1 MAG: serine/threonine protein kinase [Planctomycetota bacterium]
MSTESSKRRLGPFQLEKKLGVGGMGIVYRATYLKTGQAVALKVLAPDLSADPKIAKRFEREMDILKRLKHPHIIQYFGGSTSGAQRYYAMELLPGGTLDEVLRKKGRFSWEETVEYGLQIAQALEHAHNAGIIHRDLKPSNLLLTKKGQLKLSDFGIARDTQATQITAAGKTVGTMAYMAPEQITGKQPVSRKTDLYALGCVLFQMLTGRPPFESETQPELLFKHVEEEPPSVREFAVDVPRWLDELIDELLEKDPEDRTYDALAVQVRLKEVKQKVAEQEKMVSKTAGGGSTLTLGDGDPTMERVLGKKKKKKKRKRKEIATPFYEQTWFLSLGLALIIALVVWALWPESEQTVYERAEPLMASTNTSDWFEAEDDLQDLVERFPNGQYAKQANKWLNDIAVERKVRQITTRLGRSGYVPDNEPERLILRAREYRKFGDGVAALEVYNNMENIFSEDADPIETRAFSKLARLEAEETEAALTDESTSRTAYVDRQLEEADELYRDGSTDQARAKWQSIVRLYGGREGFRVQVHRAQSRIDDPSTALSSDEPTEDE